MNDLNAGKRRGKPFAPGQSGNPSGRPKNVERRRRFIAAYIANRYRGTKAAIVAGCPARGARVAAVRMLMEPDVRAEIDAHWKAELDEAKRLWQLRLDSMWPQGMRPAQRR